MKVGVLTGGGDCPGLNAVIRAVARRSFTRGHEVVGVRAGWRGLVDGVFEPLGPREISGLLPRGGTILGTSRTNPYKLDGGVEAVLGHFEREGFGALVATTTSPAPTTPSASTPRSGFAPRRSTGCTRRPSRTTA
jgi:6-phosphofructokinase 1